MSIQRFLFTCLVLSLFSLSVPASAVRLNLIQKENRQPGTTAWQLTNPAEDRQIEGYASLTSVPVGANIDLFVSTKDQDYSLTVFRLGWYGGKGGRKVLGPQLLPGVDQGTPAPDPLTGVFDCHWTPSLTIPVPSSWLSGIYLVKLHGNTSGKESYIVFTVRDSRRADLVFQQSVITYHAYNPWPGSPAAGYKGASLYEFQTDPELKGLPGYRNGKETGVQAQQVTFNRPYGTDPYAHTPTWIYSDQVSPNYGTGAGDLLRNLAPAAMDYGMLRWLEREGYDVTYITDVDTHEDAGRLLRAKAYLSIGHDEYVSREMKAHIVQARDSGVSLGFFGANYLYWPVQLFPDASGSPNRTISLLPSNRCVIPDPASSDPDPPYPFSISPTNTLPCVDNSDCAAGEACKFKMCNFNCQLDANGVSETEQRVAGGMWDLSSAVIASDDIVVNADAPLDHWVFAGTDLAPGDVIPGLIGTEYNSTSEDPTITPPGLVILLHTPAPNYGDPSNPTPPIHYSHDWSMTIYQASSGAWVFNAGTNQWAWGLDDYFTGLQTADGANNGPPFRDQCGEPSLHPGLVSCRHQAIERITRNVLNRFIAGNDELGLGLAGKPGVAAPARTVLHVANPFNPTTEMRFDLAAGGRVALRIYDVAGRWVLTLVDAPLQAGFGKSVTWNGLDHAGRRVPTGIYLARLEAPGSVETRKLLLLQ